MAECRTRQDPREKTTLVRSHNAKSCTSMVLSISATFAVSRETYVIPETIFVPRS
jgi:hypothetical protein